MKIFLLLVAALLAAALLGWLHAVQVDRAAQRDPDADAALPRGPLPPMRTTSTMAPDGAPPPLPPALARQDREPRVPMPEAPADTLLWEPHRDDPLALASVESGDLPGTPQPREIRQAALLAMRPDRTTPDAFWSTADPKQGAETEDESAEPTDAAQASAEEPLTASELLDSGRHFLAQHRWAEARNAFAQAVRVSDADFTVVAEAASAFCRDDRFEDAAALRDLLAAQGGALEHVSYVSAMILLSQGSVEEAKAEFEKSLQADPTMSEGHFQLGKLAQSEGDLQAAEKHLRNALFADPDYAETKYRLGVVLAAQGRHGEAEKLYRDILTAAPGDFPTIQKLGAALFSQRRYAEALVCYLALRAASPDNHDVINQIAVTLKRLGRTQEALDYFVQGLEIHPGSFVLRFNAACALVDLGNADDAIAALEALRTTHPQELARYISDSDFEPLKDRPEYVAIQEQLAAVYGTGAEAAAP